MGANPLGFLKGEIQQLKDQGIFQSPRVLESEQAPRALIDGQNVINLSSNNYLGLAGDPRLKRAAIEATERFGAGSAAVRTIIGTMSLHLELERRLKEFKDAEGVLVFGSGFACNTAVIPALVGRGDVIVSDELNHASIIDGSRLSRAEIKVYRHNDAEHCRERLAEASKQCATKILLITDGVFSMDGDIAPLPDLVEVAEEYGAIVMVDDAHASGVLGRGGRGSVDHFGLKGRVHIQVGTLSKAVGVVGGYVAGSEDLETWLINRGRPFLFSSSHPPGAIASCIEAINIMDSDPQLLKRLWDNTRRFKDALKALGFDIGNSQTPITPVMVGDGGKAMDLSRELFQAGVFVQGIVFPTVAPDRARVRAIVTAAHTHEDLDEAAEAFGQVGRRLGII